MRVTLKNDFFLLLGVFVGVVVLRAEQNQDKPHLAPESGVPIKIVAMGTLHPLMELHEMTISDRGDIFDGFGNGIDPFDDTFLALILGKTESFGRRKTHPYERLSLMNKESDTSVATLAGTLSRIHAASNPDKVKVITVFLEGLPEPEP